MGAKKGPWLEKIEACPHWDWKGCDIIVNKLCVVSGRDVEIPNSSVDRLNIPASLERHRPGGQT